MVWNVMMLNIISRALDGKQLNEMGPRVNTRDFTRTSWYFTILQRYFNSTSTQFEVPLKYRWSTSEVPHSWSRACFPLDGTQNETENCGTRKKKRWFLPYREDLDNAGAQKDSSSCLTTFDSVFLMLSEMTKHMVMTDCIPNYQTMRWSMLRLCNKSIITR